MRASWRPRRRHPAFHIQSQIDEAVGATSGRRGRAAASTRRPNPSSTSRRPGGAGGTGTTTATLTDEPPVTVTMLWSAVVPVAVALFPLVNGSVRARAAHANRDVRVEGACLVRRGGAARQTLGRDQSGSRPGGLPWATFRILRLLDLLNRGRRRSMRRPSPGVETLWSVTGVPLAAPAPLPPLVPAGSCRSGLGRDRVGLVDRAVVSRAADAHAHVDVGRSVLSGLRVASPIAFCPVVPAVESPLVDVVPEPFVVAADEVPAVLPGTVVPRSDVPAPPLRRAARAAAACAPA